MVYYIIIVSSHPKDVSSDEIREPIFELFNAQYKTVVRDYENAIEEAALHNDISDNKVLLYEQPVILARSSGKTTGRFIDWEKCITALGRRGPKGLPFEEK